MRKILALMTILLPFLNTRKWRQERLNKIIDHHPKMVGVGIDEGTAFIIDGTKTDVIGDGGIYVARSQSNSGG